MPTSKETGPSLETYVETRLNLMTSMIDKLEKSLCERIDTVETASLARKEHLASEIEHAKQLLNLSHETAKHTADKAEKTQHDINVAGNEWRATLNDFKTTVPTKSEFERFYAEFAAYRLENAKIVATQIADKVANSKTTEDWKSLAALAIAILAIVVTYIKG